MAGEKQKQVESLNKLLEHIQRPLDLLPDALGKLNRNLDPQLGPATASSQGLKPGDLFEIPSRTVPGQPYLTCGKCGHEFDV